MNLILDLEIRDDIDDILVLVYCLEKNIDFSLVVNNPTELELKLVFSLLKRFDVTRPVYINNNCNLLINNDIDKSLMWLIDNDIFIKTIDISELEIESETSYFCGGALTSLKIISDKCQDASIIHPTIQGGYAGIDVVGEENTLYKFKKRKSVPTWNLNLDVESAFNIVSNNRFERINFISKNLTHGLPFYINNDTCNSDRLFHKILLKYSECNNRNKKCLHDLTAFMTIYDTELIEFIRVNMIVSYRDRPSWSSEKSDDSNIYISKKLLKEIIY